MLEWLEDIQQEKDNRGICGTFGCGSATCLLPFGQERGVFFSVEFNQLFECAARRYEMIPALLPQAHELDSWDVANGDLRSTLDT